MAEAPDALEAVQGLVERLAKDDAGVLDGVVHVDVKVAAGLDLEVEAAMAGEALQHVVEEADAGGDRRAAGPVQVQAHPDLGLLGVAGDVGRAVHARTSPARAARSFIETCGLGRNGR